MGGKHRTPVKPGTKWGKLTVVKALFKNEHSHVMWEVRCECGLTVKTWGYHLVKGEKTHCGCGRPPTPVNRPGMERS